MVDKNRTDRLDWDDVQYFTALVRHGTLSAAARALHVNHATVFRRLAHLEALLGRPLFDRRAEGYSLNVFGRGLLKDAEKMEEAAAAIARPLNPIAMPSGLVRVTMTRGLADSLIAERLGILLAQHPDLDIEILAESRNLSLARREADIALRFGRPVKGKLLVRRVATLRYGFFAAPSYGARIKAGEKPAFVGFDASNDFVPEAIWIRRRFSSCRLTLRSNSQIAQAAAAAGGCGIVLLPHFLGQDWPGLTPIDMGAIPPPRELWLVMRPDMARIPRIRLVADGILEIFRRPNDPFSRQTLSR